VLADVIDYLRCPHCGGALALEGDAVVGCAAGHAFDVARQGYVSLLPGDARISTADSAEMVRAREGFLAGGHYDPLTTAIADQCARAAVPDGCVLELGAGTGHHLARVLERLPGRTGVALDNSRHALRRAARAHARIGAVGCDAWGALPLRSGCAALALSVFAPRNAAELRRVLAAEGTLVLATPTERHLAELVGPLRLVGVDAAKPERLARALGPHFAAAGEKRTTEWELSLDRGAIELLVAMGPSAHHVDPAAVGARIAALPEPLAVTASVTIRALVPIAP
jgi:23S rRNA (guanine745-N1)-methyltransferase